MQPPNSAALLEANRQESASLRTRVAALITEQEVLLSLNAALDYKLNDAKQELKRPGNAVVQIFASVGDRVRERNMNDGNNEVQRRKWKNKGTIVRLECDRSTELAVKWDAGSTRTYSCGKWNRYELEYVAE